jgi:hypothetical protein
VSARQAAAQAAAAAVVAANAAAVAAAAGAAEEGADDEAAGGGQLATRARPAAKAPKRLPATAMAWLQALVAAHFLEAPSCTLSAHKKKDLAGARPLVAT